MIRFLLILILLKFFNAQDYLYDFHYIYDTNVASLCANGVCAINFDLGGKTQTFPASTIRFFNPNFMLCGLQFKIIRVAQVDTAGQEISAFTADMNQPQRLFFGQPLDYNYTYCNPQIELTSTSSTSFPFGSTVTPVTLFPYTHQDCSPVKALLSSSQVYLTNGSRLERSFGLLDIDVSIFRSYGNMVNFPRNETQYVKPGDVWINFTLSRFQWAGDVPCENERKVAEGIILTFYVSGSAKADLINDTDDVGQGRSQAYDLKSGIVVMSGTACKDDEIIQVLPKYLGTDAANYRNFFQLRLAKFQNAYTYGGIYLYQDSSANCDTLIKTPGGGDEGQKGKCL